MSSSRGRPPATDHGSIVAAALGLFLERGYEHTTMDDIAAAAGISRTTLWRFFTSKSAVLWAQYDARLTELAEALDRQPADLPLAEGVFGAFRQVDARHPERRAEDKQRTRLIAAGPATPETGAWSAYREIGELIVGHVATRRGGAPGDLENETLGLIVWSAVWTATKHWSLSGDESPEPQFARALELLRATVRS